MHAIIKIEIYFNKHKLKHFDDFYFNMQGWTVYVHIKEINLVKLNKILMTFSAIMKVIWMQTEKKDYLFSLAVFFYKILNG